MLEHKRSQLYSVAQCATDDNATLALLAVLEKLPPHIIS